MRLFLIDLIGKALGVQLHYEGRPLGGRPRKISAADSA